ncbi:MAG: hypothetical protein HYX24_00080 [Candidatus Aenigmarchaeota archaeon]|nr:hypothetical protein [Candidatus Aenigmarchaeota archaeon]
MLFFGKREKKEPEQLSSREYKLYSEKKEERLSWYETLTKASGKVLKISPPAGMEADLQKAINFTGLRIATTDAFSLPLIIFIIFLIFSLSMGILGLMPYLGSLLLASLGLLAAYYLYSYPSGLMKEMRIQASSQVILAILYMVVSMRMSPNLEQAIKFAAANVSGPLAWDLRKLIWDIEMRRYYSAWHAMDDYIARWKPENEEFAESLRLIRESTSQPPDRARQVLDESLDVVLDGSKTRMKHYVQDLRMPIMMIHMMGIVLPLLGSIMAPMVAVFMSDSVEWWHFVLGYNIFLPIIIVWFINDTLKRRPITLTQASPVGEIIKKDTKPLAIAIGILLLFVSYPIYFFVAQPNLLFESFKQQNLDVFNLLMSMLIIFGAAASLGSYFLFSTMKTVKLQTDINVMEGEFELALFQLANRIGAGTPTELALEKSLGDVKDLKIASLFELTLRNMKALGYTLESALFDPQYGSLKFYPSKLVRNIMRTVVDTARKGLAYASESMFMISKYLKNIRETQEYMRELLDETVSSMRFQAYLLTPVVSGLIVAMAEIIILVLGQLGGYMDSLKLANQASGLGSFSSFQDLFGQPKISPEVFQLIIGTYLIQVIFILASFITKITYGENRPMERYLAGKMLLVGVFIYFIVSLTASVIFIEFIKDALGNIKVV